MHRHQTRQRHRSGEWLILLDFIFSYFRAPFVYCQFLVLFFLCFLVGILGIAVMILARVGGRHHTIFFQHLISKFLSLTPHRIRVTFRIPLHSRRPLFLPFFRLFICIFFVPASRCVRAGGHYLSDDQNENREFERKMAVKRAVNRIFDAIQMNLL